MRKSLLFAVLAALSGPALAVPVTIDFTATAAAYIVYNGDWNAPDVVDTLPHREVSGSFTCDADLALPGQIVVHDEATHYLQFAQRTDFISSSVTWALGTYSPSGVELPEVPVPAGDVLSIQNAVNNEPIGGWPSDSFTLQDGFQWGHPELTEASRPA